eukprot:6022280-Amphidinium_carterae.1
MSSDFISVQLMFSPASAIAPKRHSQQEPYMEHVSGHKRISTARTNTKHQAVSSKPLYHSIK